MSTDIPHFTSLAQALVELFGKSVALDHTDRVSGGDINRSYALTLTNGAKVFMKANAKEHVDFFYAETAGLNAIAQTKTIKTPHVLCTGTDNGEQVGYSFLLMDVITSAQKNADYWQKLAHNLALMHKADTSSFVTGGTFGFNQNNFIGAGKQYNNAHDSWISFFRDCRLMTKLKKAEHYFDSAFKKKCDRLLSHLDGILVEPKQPSLLHGDLWSGNVMCGSDGNAWLIDPAAYVGHAEADIAMTQLFGGFSLEFFEAYKAEGLLMDGYEERRDLYNLYHLLNHLNLFGSTYLEPVHDIVDEYANR